MSHIHNGIYEFNSGEITALTLGQAGFKVIDASGGRVEIVCGTTAGYENLAFFVGIKSVEADTDVQANTLVHGDDFCKDGTYVTGTTSNDITMLHGDLIFGVFDKITVANGDFAIAYIGR